MAGISKTEKQRRMFEEHLDRTMAGLRPPYEGIRISFLITDNGCVFQASGGDSNFQPARGLPVRVVEGRFLDANEIAKANQGLITIGSLTDIDVLEVTPEANGMYLDGTLVVRVVRVECQADEVWNSDNEGAVTSYKNPSFDPLYNSEMFFFGKPNTTLAGLEKLTHDGATRREQAQEESDPALHSPTNETTATELVAK